MLRRRAVTHTAHRSHGKPRDSFHSVLCQLTDLFSLAHRVDHWQLSSATSHHFLSDNRAANARRGVANWLDPNVNTLAKQLTERGYQVGHFGKWHMGGQRDVDDAPLITQYGFKQSLTNFEGLDHAFCRCAMPSMARPSRNTTWEART